jgi:hypothetical protein
MRVEAQFRFRKNGDALVVCPRCGDENPLGTYGAAHLGFEVLEGHCGDPECDTRLVLLPRLFELACRRYLRSSKRTASGRSRP